LDAKKRSPEEEMKMLLLAHTSRYHWELVGSPANKAVGDWQLSRVYASIGDGDLAIRFAVSALASCRRHHLSEFTPSAFEGVARAYAVARDSVKAERYLARAREELGKAELDNEDRKIYLAQIRDTQRLLKRLSVQDCSGSHQPK